MSDNFWARRIAQESSQTPSKTAWGVPTPPPAQRPIETVALSQPSPAPRQEGCPSCGSGNYTTVNGADPRAIHKIKRCFDCGYPVVQSTSGMSNHQGGHGTKGTPARQIETMTVTSETGRVLGTTQAASGRFNNYHPQDTRAGEVS